MSDKYYCSECDQEISEEELEREESETPVCPDCGGDLDEVVEEEEAELTEDLDEEDDWDDDLSDDDWEDWDLDEDDDLLWEDENEDDLDVDVDEDLE